VSAQAETIVLVEGDTILGEILEKKDSAIILIHKVLGELEIPKDQIASVTFVHDILGEIKIPKDYLFALSAGKPEVETVVLMEGDTIHGKITDKTDSTIILVHKVLGKLEIPKDQITSITVVHEILGEITIPKDQILSLATGTRDTESPEEKTSREVSKDQIIPSSTMESYKQKNEGTTAVVELQDYQQTKVEEEKEIWFEPEFTRLNSLAGRLKKQKWSFAFDFSINTTSGNTNEEATRLGAHIKRRLPRERMALDGAYYRKKNTGSITDNELTVGYLKDWLNPGSQWFFFGAGRFDYDEFESWEKRANIQVGPGYSLIESDDMLLNFRLGAGGRREWGSKNSDLKFEGLTGLDFEWQLTKKQALETSVWFFPVITDFDDHRTRSRLNWRYKLSEEMDLSLLLGVLHETQSIVDPGDDDSDTRVYTGIQLGF
jgi:putative salt-induced outer membrane protein YdiY